jgi:hypothetical protein
MGLPPGELARSRTPCARDPPRSTHAVRVARICDAVADETATSHRAARLFRSVVRGESPPAVNRPAIA